MDLRKEDFYRECLAITQMYNGSPSFNSLLDMEYTDFEIIKNISIDIKEKEKEED